MNFDQICKDIKSLKIQGAENIAIAAVEAYSLNPTKEAVKMLISLRPTEPALRNALRFVQLDKKNINLAIAHLKHARKSAAEIASRLIKNNDVVYTHCHSSTVNMALIEAKNNRKNFEVYCTETRPFMQGRITATDMAKAKIPVTLFVDSAMRLAIKKSNLCFIGADAITADLKAINKVGSELAADTAQHFEIPFYVITDSWKFDPKTLFGFEEEIEKRGAEEVWENPPKDIRISNYVFEKVNPNSITAIISELGMLSPQNFMVKVLEKYPWMIE